MQTIHFNNISKNPLDISLLIISFILYLFAIFQPINLDNLSIYNYSLSLGLIINFTVLGKIFWFKNIIQWNKKGVIIKINSVLKSTSLNFTQIKTITLSTHILKIYKQNGDCLSFNLKHIEPSDQQKLYKLIKDHLITNKVL